MDLQAIASAAGGLKAAAEMARAFVDLKTAVEVQGKVFELQRVILAAQQDTFAAQETQAALLEEKRGLEQKIAELEASSREKERYQLSEVGRGVFAFTLRPEFQGAEPTHYACANCFDHGRRSILQGFASVYASGERQYRCVPCGLSIVAKALASDGAPRERSTYRSGPVDWKTI